MNNPIQKISKIENQLTHHSTDERNITNSIQNTWKG